jgi:CRISPR/Cas system-associated endonuclease Cas3-HD
MYLLALNLLFLILFLYIIKNTSANKSFNLILRNKILRIYIADDKKKLINEYSNKIIIKTKSKVNEFYNKILSKYYDMSLFYNSLTDEEKEIIETIVSLCY